MLQLVLFQKIPSYCLSNLRSFAFFRLNYNAKTKHCISLENIPEQFSDAKYINLETLRKNGTAVKTPVWFVTYNDLIYVITREHTGKVKRLRNNSKLRICPCSFKGEPKGEWISGNATLVEGDEAKNAISLRKKKYGIKALLAGFMTRSKGDSLVYSIKLD